MDWRGAFLIIKVLQNDVDLGETVAGAPCGEPAYDLLLGVDALVQVEHRALMDHIHGDLECIDGCICGV